MTTPEHKNTGQILQVTLPTREPLGHEQTGTRPCILLTDLSTVQPLRYPMIVIAPLTTKTLDPLPLYPRLTEGVGSLPVASTVLLDQLCAIDANRVQGYVGTLTEEEFNPIKQGLLLMFGLNQTTRKDG